MPMELPGEQSVCVFFPGEDHPVQQEPGEKKHRANWKIIHDYIFSCYVLIDNLCSLFYCHNYLWHPKTKVDNFYETPLLRWDESKSKIPQAAPNCQFLNPINFCACRGNGTGCS